MTKSIQLERVDLDRAAATVVDQTRSRSTPRPRGAATIKYDRLRLSERASSDRPRPGLLEVAPDRVAYVPRVTERERQPGIVETAVSLLVLVLASVGANRTLAGELFLAVAILLSAPGVDFAGGEFVLAEQRPRMQSRVEVVPLRRGDAVAFAVRHRPVQGTRGVYRVNLRHGVSRVRSGRRHTLGVIFHDAK